MPEPHEVTRYDVGSRLSLSPRQTDEGFRLYSGRMAKAGVMPYRQADGSILWELIPEDELLDAESLGTLGLKPVCTEHPEGGVDPSNARQLTDGVVSPKIKAVRTVEGGYVDVELIVLNEDALDAVDLGKRQLSPGYRCLLDPTPGADARYATDGNPEGRWDAVQRRRRYNHLAIVDAARGGPTVALHLDAAVQIRDGVPTAADHRPAADHSPTETSMRTALIALLAAASLPTEGVLNADAADSDPLTLPEIQRLMKKAEERGDGAGRQVALDAVMQAYSDLDAKYRDMAKMVEDLKAKMPEGEEEQDRGDTFEARVAWAADRRRYLELADKRGVTLENVDALDNPAIARELAKALNPRYRDDSSDEYVAATLDVLAAQPEPEVHTDHVDPYAEAFTPRQRTDNEDAAPARTASELSLASLRGDAA